MTNNSKDKDKFNCWAGHRIATAESLCKFCMWKYTRLFENAKDQAGFPLPLCLCNGKCDKCKKP